MAARRLVIVMLVLLGVSTLAAVFVPAEPPGEGEEETTTVEPPEMPEPRGALVREQVMAGAGPPTEVVVEAGDQLALTVRSGEPDQVAIPALGLLEPVARLAPARFDLLLGEPDTYVVRLVDTGRTVARIEVEPREDDAAPQGERLPDGSPGSRLEEQSPSPDAFDDASTQTPS